MDETAFEIKAQIESLVVLVRHYAVISFFFLLRLCAPRDHYAARKSVI